MEIFRPLTAENTSTFDKKSINILFRELRYCRIMSCFHYVSPIFSFLVTVVDTILLNQFVN